VVALKITANVEFTNVKITYVLLGTMLLTNSNKNERQMTTKISPHPCEPISESQLLTN
jgi:hypothetical protein